MSFIGQRIAQSRCPLQWAVDGFIVGSALLSLTLDSLRAAPEAGSDAHLAFGAMLCLGVLCRFRYGPWQRDDLRVDEIAAFARRLIRSLFLLLYTLVGLGIILNLGGGGAPPEALQPYLWSGVAAIILTRGLTMLHPTRLIK